MAAKPVWILQLPGILRQIESVNTPVVDRAMIEHLFGVRRRRAIQLMHSFGGYQAGKTFLVSREALTDALRQAIADPKFTWEEQRKRRLAEALERVATHRAATRVRIPVATTQGAPQVTSLPPGVILDRGRLLVEFGRPEELLEKLYRLSQAIAADFEAFCRAVQ